MADCLQHWDEVTGDLDRVAESEKSSMFLDSPTYNLEAALKAARSEEPVGQLRHTEEPMQGEWRDKFLKNRGGWKK
jgi:hypothetical protein